MQNEITVISPLVIGQTAVAEAVMNLTETRQALVGGIGKVGTFLKDYSKALDQAFDLTNEAGEITTKWYDLKGKLNAGVKAERANFVADMMRAGYVDKNDATKPSATVDTYWQRVKEASGYVTAGNRASGSGETNIVEKTKDDLRTILNRINKARNTKPAGFEILLEVYDDLEVCFATVGGNPDKDLS